jgi:hypothetical protein
MRLEGMKEGNTEDEEEEVKEGMGPEEDDE